MYSKYKLEKLIQKYGPKFKKLLGLNSYKIKIYVYKSTDQAVKKISSKYRINKMGLSLTYTRKKATIYIFYDNISNKKEAVSTLLHEFLHIRMYELCKFIPIKHRWQGDSEEEYLILDLERLYEGLL
jgi:hypothetical protein